MDYIAYFRGMTSALLEGQVAIITGASRGIGRATAELFAKAGSKIVIGYSQREDLAKQVCDNVTAEGGEAIVYKGDVSDYAAAGDMIAKTIDKYGRIDILVNNAGITDPRWFLEIAEDAWDKMLDINLKSVYNCCKHALPYMIQQEYGRIISISSDSGKAGSMAGAHYCAAKAGVIGFTKAIANQMVQYNITANAIAPGLIDTEMIRWRTPEQMKEDVGLIPLKRVGRGVDVAQAAVFLASKYAGYITGYTLDINGGLYMD
jgi:3-oxoacyl-[acyl-carrier protein] reductase